MNKSESKFYHTALRMDAALMTLLSRKAFGEITVTDVCREAEVNRSTFYAHYENTHDLLKETHANTMRIFLRPFLKVEKEGQQGRGADAAGEALDMDRIDANIATPEYLMPYLEFVKENRKLYRIYLEHLADFTDDSQYRWMIEKIIVAGFQKNGYTSDRAIRYVSSFYVNGITAVVQEWLERDCQDEVQYIYDIIHFCIFRNTD